MQALTIRMKAEFAGMPVVGDGPGAPSRFWAPRLTRAIPARWPPAADSPRLYYAYATSFDPRLADGQPEAAPWGKFELHADGSLKFERLSSELRYLGIQGIWPASVAERALMDEVQRAGGLEELLGLAATHAEARLLLRRSYCQWQAVALIAREVLRGHPELTAALDCASLPQPAPPPARPPALDALLYPAFNRVVSPEQKPVLRLGYTPHGLPEHWPVLADTPIAYYGYWFRVFEADAVPKRREVWAPFARVRRNGPSGAFFVEDLDPTPPALGIRQGRAPRWIDVPYSARPPEWSWTRERTEEALVQAASDPAVAATVRRIYDEWRESDELVARQELGRHPAFRAFLAAR